MTVARFVSLFFMFLFCCQLSLISSDRDDLVRCFSSLLRLGPGRAFESGLAKYVPPSACVLVANLEQNPLTRPIISQWLPSLLRSGIMWLLVAEAPQGDHTQERWLLAKDARSSEVNKCGSGVVTTCSCR